LHSTTVCDAMKHFSDIIDLVSCSLVQKFSSLYRFHVTSVSYAFDTLCTFSSLLQFLDVLTWY